MILVFFGPPGAGKGTQAKLISNFLNIPHLSTGEILRNKLSQDDSISNKLKQIIDKGKLVSDDILNEIIKSRLNEKDCSQGFILDGYPRTMEQSIFLNDYLISKNIKIDFILDIKIDEEMIIERIKSRSDIEKREDDKLEVIRTRLSKYKSQTKPLSDYYFSKLPSGYKVVDGNQKINEIHEEIIKIIKNQAL